MARVKRVNNSRKAHTCGRGGHEIPKGDPYLTASPGYRGRPKYRCLAHPFRPSELTTSLASEPLAAVEAFEDAVNAGFDSMEDLESAWDEVKTAAEDYVNQRQDALDQWEHGNSQLEEYVDTAQAALDELEDHTFEDFADDEPDEDDPDSWDGNDDFESAHEAWEYALTEHITSQAEEALNVAQGVEW